MPSRPIEFKTLYVPVSQSQSDELTNYPVKQLERLTNDKVKYAYLQGLLTYIMVSRLGRKVNELSDNTHYDQT